MVLTFAAPMLPEASIRMPSYVVGAAWLASDAAANARTAPAWRNNFESVNICLAPYDAVGRNGSWNRCGGMKVDAFFAL